MKQNENISKEELLISDMSVDELIKKKMEAEILQEFEISKKKHEVEIISDISKISAEDIFSKKSVFKVFNRLTKTVSYINGVQADSMLGLQNNVRQKIRKGEMDAFSTDNTYVKFEKIKLNKDR